MPHFDEFRRCLIDLDVEGAIRFWRWHRSGFPAPNDADALVTLHMARTAADSIPMKLRAYSHCWLLDHGYPSQLPDRLKPRAERLYPKLVGAVGISVNSKHPVVVTAIHGAMRHAVLEAYADGHKDEPEKVRQRMNEARMRERRGLGL
jgi:hypothetical protein